MKHKEKKSMLLKQFSRVDSNWPLSHALTTRAGGVSQQPFDSLNVGIHVGDDISSVIENRSRVCTEIGASTERFVAMQQCHTANVLAIKSESQFGGFKEWEKGQENIDAIVTNMKNVTLFSMAADCVMTLFYDPNKNVLALAHAGWRGTMLNIYSNVLNVMALEYGTKPEDVFVGISPAISCENYEVGVELISKLKLLYTEPIAKKFYKEKNNSFYLDMKSILRHQLLDNGVTNVESMEICTSDNINQFYSHRKESGKTGRFGIFAYLK